MTMCFQGSYIQCYRAHVLNCVFVVHKIGPCHGERCTQMWRHCRQVIGKFKIVVQKLKEQGK
jgi:hypothetical protein